MKLTKKLEAEIKNVYLMYWESYFSGNLKKFASTLDPDYKLIGTSESEIVNSKTESVQWLKASVKEIKGKAEFRKRKIAVSLIDGLAMVNEFSDAYLLQNKEWKFYSKIRISTFLRLTKNGWKIVQQHGSLPDARTEAGETVSFETLSKENLQLKEAVQRRTAELEEKNRELEIEASLERVRSRSIAMHKSEELKQVIRVVLDQFVLLNINVGHAGFYIDYKAHDDMHIWLADPNIEPFFAVIPYFDTPTWNSFLEAKSKGITVHSDLLDFKTKNKFYKSLFKLFEIPEEAKEFYLQCKGLAVSTVLLENVGLYIENFDGTPYTNEENNILLRFGKVFQQVYTRFLDLQKAEAQAREANIEASLERMRSVAMSIRKTEELITVAESLYKELKLLGISNIRNAQIVIKIEGDEMYLVCVYSDDTSEVFTESRYETSPATQQMYDELETSNEALYQRELTGKDFEQWMQWRESTGSKIEKKLLNARSVSFCLYSFGDGHLGISTYNNITEEQLTVLKRFKNVFELSYRRFMDVAKSEEQALKLKQEKERLEQILHELQSTQKQLIQSEKMASLGELTAGIAHEIQNPLNFVNNFSEVSNELIDEMNEELNKGDFEEAKVIASDVKQNLEKIHYHGKRADAIVKGMLQHSRGSSGQKELTDLSVLCDEYLRLSYHGLRAKDKSFNAKFETDFDTSIEKINIVPQDIGRVILNLINNAFYAVNEKKKTANVHYEPTVKVSTKKELGKILISVSDNGNGIPEKIKNKIFQPFFTTKPTGQGTGLGLSLSYDIITKGHGGELKVETKEGEGSKFIIQLPATV